MSFIEELLSLLGKKATSNEVANVIHKYNLIDVYDDPPGRKYVGSSEAGVDLLFENDEVFDIQIYVQGTKTHTAFSEGLPFEVRRGMTEKQIHALFGEPGFKDVVGSKYLLSDGSARLAVVYDKSRVVSYLSIRKM